MQLLKNISPGKIFLIPTPIGDNQPLEVLPSSISTIINNLNVFLVENEKSAKRFLAKIGFGNKLDRLTFHLLNKKTPLEKKIEYIQIIQNGINVGIISEAGTPAIADPGSTLIKLAHENKIKIKPIVGPSSIILGLSASGLNGQNFSFIGYLPIEKTERKRKIKFIENLSHKNKQTQIFIETPYRNNELVKTLLKTCNPNTMLCIASAINSQEEKIITLSVEQWKKNQINLHKKPTIFLIHKY